MGFFFEFEFEFDGVWAGFWKLWRLDGWDLRRGIGRLRLDFGRSREGSGHFWN